MDSIKGVPQFAGRKIRREQPEKNTENRRNDSIVDYSHVKMQYLLYHTGTPRFRLDEWKRAPIHDPR